MKCDTDPLACQPCRQKGLRCFTTDRVTGHARERGQSDRADNEINFLRDQLAAYQRTFGSLTQDNGEGPSYPYMRQPDGPRCVIFDSGGDGTLTIDYSALIRTPAQAVTTQYVGWPAPPHSEPLHVGPVNGSKVDILDGTVDVADFECEQMRDYPQDERNKFNMSRTSITNTFCGYQSIADPRLPSKEEALQMANQFLTIMAQYIPVLHKASFMELVWLPTASISEIY